MFDVSWSELLILGLVTLIFVGPKELPRFLNTLGRYLGVVRRQANEFRSVFEQALREAEMDQIQKEVRAVSDGLKASLDEATTSVDSVRQAARVDGPSHGAPSALPSAAPKPEAIAKPAGEGVVSAGAEPAQALPPTSRAATDDPPKSGTA
jgi:sec-independent protein translocase protein TatB